MCGPRVWLSDSAYRNSTSPDVSARPVNSTTLPFPNATANALQKHRLLSRLVWISTRTARNHGQISSLALNVLADPLAQPDHDDHRDAHVVSLRLALGTILSPVPPRSPPPPHHPAHHALLNEHLGHRHPALHCPHSFLPSATPDAHHPGTPLSHRSTPIPPPFSHPRGDALAPQEPTHAVPAIDTPHGHVPDVVSSARTPSGSMTPGARADFIGTLQSKSAWEALIHGSWM
ncbi:hypothetical protein A0H81_05182 [Grifola frondosa]|uniref:Uncharacterized protein n=1 Tax=Grifola frondosa TaxID=5627 RepID=A0A1C7MDC2_GRIFR|nr:hypothetical protein A0H81_05182 [Grifola frondosa]